MFPTARSSFADSWICRLVGTAEQIESSRQDSAMTAAAAVGQGVRSPVGRRSWPTCDTTAAVGSSQAVPFGDSGKHRDDDYMDEVWSMIYNLYRFFLMALAH